MVDRARRRLRAEQDGYTLVELLVVAALGLIVLGGAVTLLITTTRQEPEARARAAALDQARVMTENLTREVREGYGVESAGSSNLTLLSYVHRDACGGATANTVIVCKITYSCTVDRCTRRESDPAGSGGTEVEVVRDLASSAIFSYTPSATAPTYVGVKLEVAEDRTGNSVTVEGGAALRNETLGS